MNARDVLSFLLFVVLTVKMGKMQIRVLNGGTKKKEKNEVFLSPAQRRKRTLTPSLFHPFPLQHESSLALLLWSIGAPM